VIGYNPNLALVFVKSTVTDSRAAELPENHVTATDNDANDKYSDLQWSSLTQPD
jgi:hypothetical protein